MKKLFALLLALTLALSLGAVAFAAGEAATGSITIKNSIPGREYSVYKIFDATFGEDGEVAYTYAGELAENDYFTQDEAGNISAKSETLSAEAIAFLNGLRPEEATATNTATGTTLVFDDLPYGYYYIEANGKTAVTVDTTMPDVTVFDKNNVPSWDNEPGDDDDTGEDPNPGKVIIEDGKKVKVNSVNYGEPVEFSIAVNAYSYVLNETSGKADLVTYYYITDTLADGFGKADNIEVSVFGVDKDGEYLATGSDITNKCTIAFDNENENKFVITVPFGEQYGSKAKIEVTYSAVVNADGKDVVIAGEGNPNEAIFSYDVEPIEDPEDPPFDPEKPEDPDYPDPKPEKPDKTMDKKTTITYVYAIGIQKVDENGNPLAGATFSVKKDDTVIKAVEATGEDGKAIAGVYDYSIAEGAKTVFATDENGVLLIKGLEAGIYAITEEAPPAGYNKLGAPVEVTAAIESTSTYTETITIYKDADGKVVNTETENGTKTEVTVAEKVVPVVVENHAGVELPSTGGIGTTIFYVVGAVLVAGAAIVLFAKKRAEE